MHAKLLCPPFNTPCMCEKRVALTVVAALQASGLRSLRHARALNSHQQPPQQPKRLAFIPCPPSKQKGAPSVD